jgi:toxin ParE1/3/4
VSQIFLITPDAEEDLAEAKAWNNRQKKGLGDEFIDNIDAAVDRIRRIPEGATEVYPGVRRVVVQRFPYGVFYKVEPDHIAIIAIYQNKRDPRGWQSRAPDN